MEQFKYEKRMYVNKAKNETFETQRDKIEEKFCDLFFIYHLVDSIICTNILIDKIIMGVRSNSIYVDVFKHDVKLCGISIKCEYGWLKEINIHKDDITENDYKYIKQSAYEYLCKDKYQYYKTLCDSAGIDPEGECDVKVANFYKYQQECEKVVHGKFREIVYNIAEYNEHMKYCNGSYQRISDPKVERAAQALRNMSDNYYLDVAVKMGVTID